MTFRTSISSKGNPRDTLRRGLKSMFPNYDYTPEKQAQPVSPPLDTENEQSKENNA